MDARIQEAVERVARQGAQVAAVFDADGTVWSGDIGEEVLKVLVDNGRLLSPPPRPFERYLQLFQDDPPRAFAYCVEVMQGLAIADVARWSDELYQQRFAACVFPDVRAALGQLTSAGVRVHLVSASNAVTVRSAAQALGLDPSLVLAVEGEVADGRYTGNVLEPVTSNHGKVQAIQARIADRPAIAFGNSLFDREMLEHAQQAVMVAPAGVNSAAVELARAEGWLICWVPP